MKPPLLTIPRLVEKSDDGLPSIVRQSESFALDIWVASQITTSAGITCHGSVSQQSMLSMNSLKKNMSITNKRTSERSTGNWSHSARHRRVSFPHLVTKPLSRRSIVVLGTFRLRSALAAGPPTHMNHCIWNSRTHFHDMETVPSMSFIWIIP